MPNRQRRHDQLPDQVATYVRELILSGAVAPGTFLRLEPIAQSLAISSTPVREGLQTLRNEGFVRLLPRRGFVVQPVSREDLEDVYWAQAKVAGELAARACARVSAADLTALHEAVDRATVATREGDVDALSRAGHDFHRRVNLAAGSRRLAILAGSISRHLPIRMYTGVEAQAPDLGSEHAVVLEALERRDPHAAATLMSDHVQSSGRRLLEMLEERDVLPAKRT